VLGPNGAGKPPCSNHRRASQGSTQEGHNRIHGKGIHRLALKEFPLSDRYVPEDRGLFRELTLKENLDLGCWGRKDSHIQEDLEFLFSFFLFSKRASPAGRDPLRRRTANARCGASHAPTAQALMLDEPTLGLAPRGLATFTTPSHRSAGWAQTILLVEQNAKLALSIAHFGYIMESGRIVLEGTSDTLKNNEDVKELYLGLGGESLSPKGWRLYKKRRTW